MLELESTVKFYTITHGVQNLAICNIPICRYPDFQQLVELDEVPTPVRFNTAIEEDEETVLYKVH